MTGGGLRRGDEGNPKGVGRPEVESTMNGMQRGVILVSPLKGFVELVSESLARSWSDLVLFV